MLFLWIQTIIILNPPDKINLKRSDKYVALSILTIYYTLIHRKYKSMMYIYVYKHAYI